MNKQDRINKQMKKARKVRLTNLANKGKDTYLNLKWMQMKYVIERKSLDDIAEICGVGYEEIWEALKILKIPNRLIATNGDIEKYR